MSDTIMQKMDGMTYAPVFQGITQQVVAPGTFSFSVIGLDHGHILAMTNGLLEAGATLRWVYDKDRAKAISFCKRFAEGKVAESEEVVLSDRVTTLVVSAIRPDQRCSLGLQVMKVGKDFFVDKPGMLSLADVQSVKELCEKTGRKYIIYFGERIHVEAAVQAQRMIDSGELGKIVSITILAPHRLNKASRPDWFFDPRKNGGILVDIGSHQIEQFLSYSHADSAKVNYSMVANYANPDKPDFMDFGEVSLLSDTGVSGYCRVDWFTPAGLGAWGDGRVFIVGTKATLEIRKYIDVAQSSEGDHLYFVNEKGEHHLQVTGKIGFPFFGELILDCLNRTERAITQRHVLEAMTITLQAQEQAIHIGG
ncbi:MAG: Gfo/Idh/MocA family oxidoreductase [Sphaerochaetaceae bacterium]